MVMRLFFSLAGHHILLMHFGASQGWRALSGYYFCNGSCSLLLAKVLAAEINFFHTYVCA